MARNDICGMHERPGAELTEGATYEYRYEPKISPSLWRILSHWPLAALAGGCIPVVVLLYCLQAGALGDTTSEAVRCLRECPALMRTLLATQGGTLAAGAMACLAMLFAGMDGEAALLRE